MSWLKSMCAWPTRIASMSGTCSARSRLAFSGNGVAVGHLLGEEPAGVLGERQGVAVGRGRDRPGVAGHDDDVRAGPLEPGDVDLRLLDDARELGLALDVGLVPDGDARGDQPEDADADVLATGDADLLDDEGREER